jgi:pyridoxine 5-phosphate synthase
MIRLGVNVDHVATIRQARRTSYPDPMEAARLAVAGGADQITIHLREDRRHIQDGDLARVRSGAGAPLNLEMAAAEEIVRIACGARPDVATLVPERREELTTEGGLDAASSADHLRGAVERLLCAGIEVSLFIAPEGRQVEAAASLRASAVELHTGRYCDAPAGPERDAELGRLREAAALAKRMGLRVCAGHGINYGNASALALALPEVVEYNIGHAIVARAVMVGMERAVREMKALLRRS